MLPFVAAVDPFKTSAGKNQSRFVYEQKRSISAGNFHNLLSIYYLYETVYLFVSL